MDPVAVVAGGKRTTWALPVGDSSLRYLRSGAPALYRLGFRTPGQACDGQAPATMNDEGLADAAAANPFRLPRLHPGESGVQRQSRDFAAAVKAAGKPVQLPVGDSYNHFEIPDTLASPYGLQGRAVLEQMSPAPGRAQSSLSRG